MLYLRSLYPTRYLYPNWCTHPQHTQVSSVGRPIRKALLYISLVSFYMFHVGFKPFLFDFIFIFFFFFAHFLNLSKLMPFFPFHELLQTLELYEISPAFEMHELFSKFLEKNHLPELFFLVMYLLQMRDFLKKIANLCSNV